ncbi:hypothetical protein Golob_012916, partial [Gossypium lobatum]|nr:hypothetical protein [Gossypium lobatum]
MYLLQKRSQTGLGQLAEKAVKSGRLKNLSRTDRKLEPQYWMQRSWLMYKLGKRNKMFRFHRRRSGKENLVRLVGGRIMLKKRRGCSGKVASILVLIL